MSGTNTRGTAMLKAGVLCAVLALSGCVSFMGGNQNVSVTRTGDGAPAQAVPAGTPPEDEVIGRREHPRIIAAYGGVYEDRATEIMLARMVSKLLAAADQPNTSFTITILDSSEVNAFALPGGYIYVTRGILALANDMSELAAVLAHEMAHVTLRHARARSNRVRTTEIVDRVLTGVLGSVVNAEETAQRSRMSLAAFSQSQELEADREGIKIAGRAGYDPHAAARFLTAMERFATFAGSGDENGDFLSSHPSTPDRIQRAIEAARQFGAPGIGVTEREAYMRAIDGMTFGDSASQGAIVGQRFVHPGLQLTFTAPRGYQLQNSSSAVVAVAGDGAALRFDSASVPSNVSLTDYLRSGWIAGLDPNSITSETRSGIEVASGRARTDQWVFYVSVARVDNEVYRFIFAGRDDTAQFRRDAEETVRSFRRTQQSDLAGIRTARLRLVAARPGDTAESLAGRMSGLNRGRDMFYVINNLLPGDPVTAGQSYKIVTIE